MPLLYDDPYRDVERDLGRPVEDLLERLDHGVVWAQRAGAEKKPKPHRTRKTRKGRPRARGPEWTLTSPPPWRPPPRTAPRMVDRGPTFGSWRSLEADPVSAAIDGYLDFEIAWERFGTNELRLDQGELCYFCDLDRRAETIMWLCSMGRWPWLAV